MPLSSISFASPGQAMSALQVFASELASNTLALNTVEMMLASGLALLTFALAQAMLQPVPVRARRTHQAGAPQEPARAASGLMGLALSGLIIMSVAAQAMGGFDLI